MICQESINYLLQINFKEAEQYTLLLEVATLSPLSTQIFYLYGRKCLFNDALNTFTLRLYGDKHGKGSIR